MITEVDNNKEPSSSKPGGPENSSFFVGIIYTGDDSQLKDTLKSVLRQKSAGISVSVSIFHPQENTPKINNTAEVTLIPFLSKEEFFIRFVSDVEQNKADYCTVIWNDERLFDGAFDSVRRIFSKYGRINWLTGIQASQAENGFNVSLGSTAIRRWSHKIYERNLYKNSGRYIPPASTFWRRSIWKSAILALHFVEQKDFCEDLWVAFFKTQKLYTCKIYFSASGNYDKLNRHGYKQPNYFPLIEDNVWSRAKEFFFVNNIPYLRLFYRRSGEFAPVIRFDLYTQTYFLSNY